jgi:hypothetical protein
MKITNFIKLSSILMVLTIVVSCKKKETATPAVTTTPVTTNPAPVVDEYSLKVSYTIDGVSSSYTKDIEGASSTGGSINAGATSYGNYSTSLNDGNGLVYLYVNKGMLSWTGSRFATDENFKAFFALGTYPYSKDAKSGVEIGIPINGVKWSTSLGTADQTGSTFSITGVKDAESINGYYIDVKISFSCKLYDGNGGVKTVTNGSCVGEFGNF